MLELGIGISITKGGEFDGVSSALAFYEIQINPATQFLSSYASLAGSTGVSNNSINSPYAFKTSSVPASSKFFNDCGPKTPLPAIPISSLPPAKVSLGFVSTTLNFIPVRVLVNPSLELDPPIIPYVKTIIGLPIHSLYK